MSTKAQRIHLLPAGTHVIEEMAQAGCFRVFLHTYIGGQVPDRQFVSLEQDNQKVIIDPDEVPELIASLSEAHTAIMEITGGSEIRPSNPAPFRTIVGHRTVGDSSQNGGLDALSLPHGAPGDV